MSARRKLNVAYFNASLLIALFVGGAAQSMTVVLITLAVLVGCGLHSGDIRPGRGRR